MNTIKDSQLFSPIPFSEFNPIIVYNEDLQKPKELDINKNYGHYDDLNTDHVSFYVKDYRAVRRKLEEFIPTVHTDRDLAELPQYFMKQMKKSKGSINLDFVPDSEKYNDHFVGNLTKLSLNSVYSMFVNHGNLTVLRAVEPGLRLRHSQKDCFKTASTDELLQSVLYQHCVEKRNYNSGTRSHLGHFILYYLNEANNSQHAI